MHGKLSSFIYNGQSVTGPIFTVRQILQNGRRYQLAHHRFIVFKAPCELWKIMYIRERFSCKVSDFATSHVLSMRNYASRGRRYLNLEKYIFFKLLRQYLQGTWSFFSENFCRTKYFFPPTEIFSVINARKYVINHLTEALYENVRTVYFL